VAADHAEYRPEAAVPLIVPVVCAVPGGGRAALSSTMRIKVEPASLAARLYGVEEVEEEFNCSYELNPLFETALAERGLRVTGRAQAGEPRIVELGEHRFYVATLFQPQRMSAPGAPHPLVAAFVRAAIEFAAAVRRAS